jgi:hypothetical protein
MFRTACLTLCFFFCAPLYGADAVTALDLTGVADGQYVLTIQRSVVTLQPLNLVKVSPTPTPIPTPDPTVLTARALALKTAAEKVTDPTREENAANLAGLWGLIKQQVDAGKVTGQANIATLIKNGNQMVLGVVQQRQWKPVFDLFDSQWNDQVRDNSGDAALSAYLGEAVSGLKASAPSYSVEPPKLIDKDGQLQLPPDYKAEAGGLKAINWERLLQILMMIMQLIGPLLS